MQLIKPSVEFLWHTGNPLEVIEKAGRTCYKSEHRIDEGSAKTFTKMLMDRGHEAMVEHASISYHFTCDRGVTHEMVRHRIFSFAQESTRYCNYKGGVSFIIPSWMDVPAGDYEIQWDGKDGSCGNVPEMDEPGSRWFWSMATSERDYQLLSKDGWKPQQSRSILPNSLKTEIVVTGNFREWRHFFKLRCAKASHPQMREVAFMALEDIRKRVPVLFDDDFGEL